jgi:hypothetical protein
MDVELERLRQGGSCGCECDTCHKQDEIVPDSRCGFCGLGVMQTKVRRGRCRHGSARQSDVAHRFHLNRPSAPAKTSAATTSGRSHFTVDGFLEDKLGFFVAECDCGWTTPPSPDTETAADFLMQHAYEQGILDERNGHVPK